MELWKDIVNYEGLYQVSSFGNVRSLDRYITNKNNLPQYYPGKVLRFSVMSASCSDYYQVALSKNHKVMKLLVHRLVAFAFLPTGREDQNCINHIDNDGTNNLPDNLEWCTHSENMIHAQRQGRLHAAQSSGGTIAGAKSRNQARERFAKVSGTQVGDWTIGEYSMQRGCKSYLTCVCKCGKTQDIESGRVLRGEITSCKVCSYKDRQIKR